MSQASHQFLDMLGRIANALERMAPASRVKPDFKQVVAARWRVSGTLKYLEAVQHVHHMDADWLVGVALKITAP